MDNSSVPKHEEEGEEKEKEKAASVSRKVPKGAHHHPRHVKEAGQCTPQQPGGLRLELHHHRVPLRRHLAAHGIIELRVDTQCRCGVPRRRGVRKPYSQRAEQGRAKGGSTEGGQ